MVCISSLFLTKKFYIRCIKKSISIDKDTRQIIDAYDFVPFSKYKFKGRKLFKMFNSFSVDTDLPDFPITEPPVPLKPPKQKKQKTSKAKKPISVSAVPEPVVEPASETVALESAEEKDIESSSAISSIRARLKVSQSPTSVEDV